MGRELEDWSACVVIGREVEQSIQQAGAIRLVPGAVAPIQADIERNLLRLQGRPRSTNDERIAAGRSLPFAVVEGTISRLALGAIRMCANAGGRMGSLPSRSSAACRTIASAAISVSASSARAASVLYLGILSVPWQRPGWRPLLSSICSSQKAELTS